jgi:hypothetical protein
VCGGQRTEEGRIDVVCVSCGYVVGEKKRRTMMECWKFREGREVLGIDGCPERAGLVS